LAEGAEGLGVVAFGEALAVGVEEEGVVVVGGFGEGEEGLEEAVDVGGGKEVFAAGDEGDVLEGVVDHDGEMVGGGDVLAGEDDVAEEGGIDGDFAVALIVEGEGAEALAGGSGVESPAVGGVGGEEGGALVGGEGAAGAGVEGAFRAVGSVGDAGRFLGDVAAGAEAGVEDLGGVELFNGRGVGGKAVGLTEGGARPGEAEPVEVLLDGVIKFRADAGVVDVLEAEEEGAVVLVGEAVGDEGGVGVSEMQQSGGAGCKAGDHGESLGKGEGMGDGKMAGKRLGNPERTSGGHSQAASQRYIGEGGAGGRSWGWPGRKALFMGRLGKECDLDLAVGILEDGRRHEHEAGAKPEVPVEGDDCGRCRGIWVC